MALRRSSVLKLVVFASVIGWLTLPARGQNAPSQKFAPSAADSQEAARRKIVESDRWQRVFRDFDQWLTVQRIYSAEEAAAIRADYSAKAARMSPQELQQLMENTEAKLEVLTSPEAEEARVWVAQFLSVARNAEEQIRNKRPDVLNMTASQIRHELQQFHQQRASRQQAHATFNQGRAQQVQSAQQVQTNRTQPGAQTQSAPSRAATIGAGSRSQYAPQRELRPKPLGTPIIYDIGPWGTPIIFHPFNESW